jgi:hypothetical protein
MMFREQLLGAARRGLFGKKTTARPAPFEVEHKPEEPPSASATPSEQEQALDERDLTQQAFLLKNGYTSDEVQALCALRQRYQHGGSDRAPVLYHLEFLRRLVASGRMER